MEKYINFLENQRYKIIIFTTMLVALLSISLKDLAFEGSYRIWFNKDSSIIKNYDNFRRTFSGDDTFAIAFSDENGIFTPKAIKTILELTSQFKTLEGVQKVESLSNYQYIQSVDDDIVIEDFISDTQNLNDKKELALKDNLIVDQLISDDGKTTMIAVRLSTLGGANENLNIKLMQQLQDITKQYEQKSGYRFYISGAPAITASLVNVAQKDAIFLLPLAVLSVVLLLFVFFRNWIGVVIPSVVIVFTFLITLSIQILLGHKLNNFTVNIPAFIVAIAIADSMHLFLAWVYYKNKNFTNKQSVYKALSTNLIPIALTSFTTAIGFLTLGLSDIEPVKTLGIAITSGAIIAFVLSVTLAPAILLLLDDSYKVRPIKFLNLTNVKGYGTFIVKHDKRIVLAFSLLFIFLAFGLQHIKIDSNSINYFKEDTIVRSGSDFIQKNLTGSMIYEIVLDSKMKEGIKEPVFLNEIIKFETQLKLTFPNVTFTTSLKDIIARMQKKINPSSTNELPQDKNLVAQYLLLYSMSLPQGMELNDKIDTNERYLRVTINSNIQDTSKDLAMIDWIKDYWKNETKYSADIQGQTAIFAYMQRDVTDTLISSITATLAIVAIFMFLIYRNFKMLLLFIIPNIAPIILVAGVMGYLDITIDIGVAISAAVILGIAVDDTIHFFSKYFDGIKTKTFEETIDYIISHSGNAMILTTFILSITFSAFFVSSFTPNINFAIVTIISLNIALVFDLIFVPALLSLFYKK
ncbi:MAG: MMPL family transporter [Arcobacteraceae bacterium]|nr:MMPL family transporter [Arcobacteraceae bacterium]